MCNVPELQSLAVEGEATLLNVHLSGVTTNSDDLQAAVAAAVAAAAHANMENVEIVGMADVSGAAGQVIVGVLVTGVAAGDAEEAALAVTRKAESGELAADIGGAVTVNSVYGQLNGGGTDLSSTAEGDGALGNGDGLAVAGQEGSGGTDAGAATAAGAFNIVTVAIVALVLLLLLALIALAVVVARKKRRNRVYGISEHGSHVVHATYGSPGARGTVARRDAGRTPPRTAFV